VTAGRSASALRLRVLAQRVWREIAADDATSLAAEMSYYFVLSVFPFMIFLAAIVGSLPFTDAWDGVLTWIMLYFPRQSQHLVLDTVLSLTQGRKGFLSIGLLGTAWAASGGLLSLMGALNRVYGVAETRSYLKRLGLASLMTLVLAVLLLSTFGLVTAGEVLRQWLAASSVGLAVTLGLWQAARWIVSVGLTGMGVAILDHSLPNVHRPWRWVAPGTVFVVLGWLLGTTGFDLYLQYLVSFNRTYGVLGAFVILMVWIYLASLLILIGAEINSVSASMKKEYDAVIRGHGMVEVPGRS
jgi:membrane protein